MEKLAIVTGATGGLGNAYCRELLGRGYDLIISGTKKERLESLKELLSKELSDATIWVKECDLKDEASRDSFFDFLNQEALHPSTLINCAGYILEGSFLGCNNNEVLDVTRVNNIGNIDFTYRFLKNRDTNERNYVLFVSSMGGFAPLPQMALYGATKSFLTNFSISLRRELRDENVYVTAVCPGSIATSDAMKRSIESQGMGGKLSLVSPQKIAKVSIDKLLKNKAKYIPGGFNKFVCAIQKFVPQTLIADFTYKRWVKCEKKRGEYR